MGKVINLSIESSRGQAGDALQRFVTESYERLSKVPGYVPRDAQKQLSMAVAKSLIANEPLAAEAPTGTGKTIAYLIGALAAKEFLPAFQDMPLVVATATVGLQSQILNGDIPKLVQAGILAPNTSMLAKGRGRYFCVLSAERITEEGVQSQEDFFDDTKNRVVQLQTEANNLLTAWRSRQWSGEVDALGQTTPAVWKEVAASADTCLGHKCDHYSQCPFFNARRALSNAKVIVANQDLVLADLTMAREEQEPLIPGKQYLVIFDEAHHLPNKALDVGSADLDLVKFEAELPKIANFTKIGMRHSEIAKTLTKAKLDPADFHTGVLEDSLAHLKEIVMALAREDGYDGSQAYIKRFEKGELPADMRAPLKTSLAQVSHLREAFQDATQALKQSTLVEKNPGLKAVIAELLFHAASANGGLSALDKALTLLTRSDRACRWATVSESECKLQSAPLEGGEVLRPLLWNSDRVRVCLVSATLADFDGFERFQARSGAPEALRTLKMPSPFPYENNLLVFPKFRYSPKQEERAEFEEELQQALREALVPEEGSLVLFPSWDLMKKAVPFLKAHFGQRVLCQGDQGLKTLIQCHKAKVDSGQGSILCGVATLAEGLDLPGAYCTHVVICALPFSVPTSPVEQELQEELGKAYFEKRALPDALEKLTQMVGRLMRRETDVGRITIMDKRLTHTRWGYKLLKAIPPFSKRTVPLTELKAFSTQDFQNRVRKAPEQACA